MTINREKMLTYGVMLVKKKETPQSMCARNVSGMNVIMLIFCHIGAITVGWKNIVIKLKKSKHHAR